MPDSVFTQTIEALLAGATGWADWEVAGFVAAAGGFAAGVSEAGAGGGAGAGEVESLAEPGLFFLDFAAFESVWSAVGVGCVA
jgi:hypothetical protein